jgi:histidinol-phosphate aminotransferase
MSRFLKESLQALDAYTPGEQPRDQVFVKLNTNESPFPPSPEVVKAASEAAASLRLYSDPDSTDLTNAVAGYFGVTPEEVLMTNGSDEILNFAFMAFGDASCGFAFPDITYGFYEVIADLNGIPCRKIPLKEDFTIRPEDYFGLGCNIVIPNPNAPTGIPLTIPQIRSIVESNADHIVIIDEAYVDFGGESCVSLIRDYDNLLVTQTFSKSRSLAGGRLGFGIGNPELIRDLNTLKYSCNPYNVNRMTSAAGIAAIEDEAYFRKNTAEIQRVREYTRVQLEQRGFTVLPSVSNFLFVRSNFGTAEDLYGALRAQGVLVRFWKTPRIQDWCRITIGTQEQMDTLLKAVDTIRKERGL